MSASIKSGLGVFGAIAVAFAAWLTFDPWLRTHFFVFVQNSAHVLDPILAVLLLGAFTIWAAAADKKGVAVLAGLATTATLVFSIVYWAQYSYQTKQVYLQSVSTVADDVPDFTERAAYTVANAQAKPLLGDVRGSLMEMRYVPDGDEATFNALVTRKGTFTGYEVVEIGTFDLTGTGRADTCEFDADASRRLGGHFSHSLDRAIAAVAPGTVFDSSDAYGYCEGDTPMVVVPLTRLSGWLHVTRVPAGVAVYNGETGVTEYKADIADGELPGPVFPSSLASDLRSSTEASGSYWDYVKNRAGYDTTAGDAGDPNSGNVSEFSLMYAGKDGGAYVTPLTPKGDAATIVAISEVSSTSVTSGKLNTLTLHTLSTTRVPGSTVAKNIKGDYGDLPEWAAGMGIFEITPLDQDTFVASLGQDQSIAYRVYINADGTSCLAYADGSKIRCGKVTGVGGNGVGVDLQDDGTTGAGTDVQVPATDAELEAMTDEQLTELLSEISSEVTRRMADAQQ